MAPARKDVALGIEPVRVMASLIGGFETPHRAWPGPCAKPPDPATPSSTSCNGIPSYHDRGVPVTPGGKGVL